MKFYLYYFDFNKKLSAKLYNQSKIINNFTCIIPIQSRVFYLIYKYRKYQQYPMFQQNITFND